MGDAFINRKFVLARIWSLFGLACLGIVKTVLFALATKCWQKHISSTVKQWLPVHSDYLCTVTTWLLGLYFCSLFAHLFHTTSKAHIQVRRSNSSNYQRQSTFSRFLLAYCNWNCDNFYWTDTFFDQSRPKVWCLLDRLQMYIKCISNVYQRQTRKP